MKLVTMQVGPVRRVGVLAGDVVIDATVAYAGLLQSEGHLRPMAAAEALVPPDMRQILSGGRAAIDAIRKGVDWAHMHMHMGSAIGAAGPGGLGVSYALKDVRLKAPVPDPQKIVCVGLNYRDHCLESGFPLPVIPMTFPKFADAIIGPDDAIVIPRGCQEPDWEVELTAVIGRRAQYLTAAEALDYVAGYTIGNDVSARDFQAADPQVMRGKACETFAPMGPYLLTADEVPDPHCLAIETRLNGAVMQSSNTRNLVHDVPAILAWITKHLTLMPGDLVMTGTPAGVGKFRTPPVFLKPGDILEMSIEGLGVLRNPVIAAKA